MTYARCGVHLLQPVPDADLLRLSPQVLVYAGAWENQSGDSLEKFRGYAKHLHELLPNTVIGVRWWPDDNILLKMSPQTYSDTFFKLHVPGTILMVGNEDAASKTDPDVFKHTVDLHTSVARLGTAAGVPLGLCCTPMGVPEYDQYPLLAPLFQEMANARAKGIIHWWRPNTYSPYPYSQSDWFNLIQRHVREAKKLGNFPPTFYGEFNFLRPDWGGMPNIGYQEWAAGLTAVNLPVPVAIYCCGDGIFGEGWVGFNIMRRPGFFDALVYQTPRTTLTAYQEWSKDTVVSIPLNPHDPYPMRVANSGVRLRSGPDLSAATIRTLILNEQVDLYKTTTDYVADTYIWRYLKDKSGSFGWAAETIKGVPTFKPLEVDKPLVLMSPFSVPATITQHFGNPCRYPGYPNMMKHEGTDLVAEGCTTFILAPADGTVDKFVFNATGYGNYIRLNHGSGWFSWLCHLKYPAFVCEVGQSVKQGDIMGIMGATGNATGPHLHLTVQHIGFGITSPEYVLPNVVDPESLFVRS